MHPDVTRAVLALALALAGSRFAMADVQSSERLPNGAVVAPGALQSRALPAGVDTGTPAASKSLPLGTPAAPPVLVGPDPSATPLGSADSSRPPRLTQDPIARSLPHDAGDRAAPRDDGRRLDHNRTTEFGPAVTSTHDVGNFPPGLARCTNLVDRDERAACAHRLYDPGFGR